MGTAHNRTAYALPPVGGWATKNRIRTVRFVRYSPPYWTGFDNA
jgi:hypothetical protein